MTMTFYFIYCHHMLTILSQPTERFFIELHSCLMIMMMKVRVLTRLLFISFTEREEGTQKCEIPSSSFVVDATKYRKKLDLNSFEEKHDKSKSHKNKLKFTPPQTFTRETQQRNAMNSNHNFSFFFYMRDEREMFTWMKFTQFIIKKILLKIKMWHKQQQPTKRKSFCNRKK